MKVQVTVDIPEGYELADVEMREPTEGEYFVAHNHLVQQVRDAIAYGPRVIVRPAWKWPEFLGKDVACVWLCHSGVWWASEDIPKQHGDYWLDHGRASRLDLMNWTPPPCIDWRTSLRVDPNRREATE